MFSVTEVIRRNSDTYYEGDPTNRTGRTTILTSFVVVSLFLGFVVKAASNEFLNGALSAQAILVGFSFNVLFYLVANRLTAPAAFDGPIHELRFERLAKLSDEVFDNVIYFNLVAVSSVVMALLLLLIGSHQFDNNIHKVGTFISLYTHINSATLSWAKWTIAAVGLSTLIFLLIESVYTFLRSVGRVRFYFGMLKTMNDSIP